MEVIPSIDIEKGYCVKRIQGKPGTGFRIGDPLKIAERWIDEGASRLHIVDLEGASEGKPVNKKVIAEIACSVDIPIQVGGGLRRIEDFLWYVEVGVDKVIAGTAAYKNPRLISELAGRIGGERIIVALDSFRGRLALEGWSKAVEVDLIEYARRFEPLKVSGFLYTNIEVEGRLEGVDSEAVRSLTSTLNTPILYAGGVSSLEDLIKLKKLGVSAVIVGRALYEGLFSFKEAVEVCV